MLRGHAGPVYRLTWAGDSRLLVTASEDSTMKLWDAKVRTHTPSHTRMKLWVARVRTHTPRLAHVDEAVRCQGLYPYADISQSTCVDDAVPGVRWCSACVSVCVCVCVHVCVHAGMCVCACRPRPRWRSTMVVFTLLPSLPCTTTEARARGGPPRPYGRCLRHGLGTQWRDGC